MSCDRYEKLWLGELTDAEFSEHRAQCQHCEQAATQDLMLEKAAQDLDVPPMSDDLWQRIVADRPQAKPEPTIHWLKSIIDPRCYTGWKLAAALATVLVLSSWQPWRPALTPVLLTEQALARVEQEEQDYLLAIAELEIIANPVIAEADTELLLRYRMRLELIDSQITRCRRALDQDGANAHIRRYILAAYQDKQATLTELLALGDS